MKRIPPPKRVRPAAAPVLRVLAPQRSELRLDGRVALAVLWAVGRLAQRLGPAA